MKDTELLDVRGEIYDTIIAAVFAAGDGERPTTKISLGLERDIEDALEKLMGSLGLSPARPMVSVSLSKEMDLCVDMSWIVDGEYAVDCNFTSDIDQEPQK